MIDAPPTSAPAPLPVFEAGDRAWYGKAPCVVVVDDHDSDMVYISFGSRQCFKPRGTLIPIPASKAKESTKVVVARGVERMAKSVPKTLDQHCDWELSLTMREVGTMEELRALLRRLHMEMVFSPVATFGMLKMRVSNAIRAQMRVGVISVKHLRGKLDEPQ